MANYYDASMTIGGPIPEDLFLDLVQAIDEDDPEDCDYQGLDAASFVGEFIQLGCESRRCGDFSATREFCNTHRIAYDLDSQGEGGGEFFRYSFRPGSTVLDEYGWPSRAVPLVCDSPAVTIAEVRAILDRMLSGTACGVVNEIRALCDRNTRPELEPISLAVAETEAAS